MLRQAKLPLALAMALVFASLGVYTLYAQPSLPVEDDPLVRLPGIGKRTAERLMVEMRDRLDRLELGASAVAQAAPVAGVSIDTPVSDAVGALIALGYKPNEASRMVRSVDSEGLSSEEIIRTALKATAVNSK